jgi:4-coumarate--CoA ligase
VPPAELEALLISHPEVSDSGVIGIFSNAEATELPRFDSSSGKLLSVILNILRSFRRAYIVPADASLLEPANKAKAAAFSKKIDDWVKTKVAQHKFLRGGKSFFQNVDPSTRYMDI